MGSMNIAIRGNSAAGWCCAHLLRDAGFKPVVERTDRPGVPAIMLSQAALTLIRDVFGKPDLFRAAPPIKRRGGQVGKNLPPVRIEFDHSAVVVSERELLAELRRGVDVAAGLRPGPADFSDFCVPPAAS